MLFTQSGYAAVSPETVRSLIGEGLPNLLRLASGEQRANAITDMVQQYRQAYDERMLHTTAPYPGIPDILDQLQAMSLPMCVLSNKPHEFTDPICRALLAKWPFVKCWGHKPGSPRKPNPSTALELAAAMECSPDRVCFVGDSSTDIDTAKNAGMFSVAVTWGYRDVDSLQSAAPNAMARTPKELLSIITSSE